MPIAAALPVEPGAASAGGRRRLVVIVVAVCALMAAGGGATAWFFHQKTASAQTNGDAAKPADGANAGKPVFMALDNFTVKLAGGEHFMQLGIVLQLKNEATAGMVRASLPQIRDRIVLLLSSKAPAALQSSQGKQALVAELLADAREPLHAGGENVEAVLLGPMLIQ